VLLAQGQARTISPSAIWEYGAPTAPGAESTDNVPASFTNGLVAKKQAFAGSERSLVETPAFHSAKPLSHSGWASIPVRDPALAVAESDQDAARITGSVTQKDDSVTQCKARPTLTQI
jgi:hypothetical protein